MASPVRSSEAPARESVAVEDYLEQILGLVDQKGIARVADLAEILGIAQASVSNMASRLDDKGFVKREKYRGMTLTEKGEKLARSVVKRHGILAEFLELIGIDPETAYRDVEGMEHHISSGTLRGIEQLIEEMKADQTMTDRVRKHADGES